MNQPAYDLPQDLCRRFINQLRQRNRINLVPFDEAEWFRGAYSTIQRTLHHGFRPFSDQQKRGARALFFRSLPLLGTDSFEENLKNLIERVACEYGVSIGHSQKLVSILLKYCATAAAASPDGGLPSDLEKLVENSLRLFPVPIDAVVLFNLKLKFARDFPDIQAGSSVGAKGRTYWAKVKCGVENVGWSRLSDYPTYLKLQTRIGELARRASMAPLHFEMNELWPAE